ncbi:hypothetical protein NQ314_001970 [Rhamnusium bicolor]|uniref:Peptidase aspartic putative domain-containing protein n=1 Tax=Rhamnusium bicolor TaxID=1586634 RepID=A0AAV8ZTV1_9CUCU|nr:hypothetical protein NQ314_001970 [Rhamnusium bicolor]
MAELTALVGKRGSIKGSITRLEKFIDELDNDVTVSILKSRLKFLEELYSKYDDVQLSLEIKDANEYSSDRDLRELLSKFGQHFNSLKALGAPVEHWDIMLVYVVSQKLDNAVVCDYESQRDKSEFPNLSKFLDFLEQRCAMLELTSRDSGAVKRTSTNASQVSSSKCVVCNNPHFITKCNKFNAMSIEERRDFTRTKRLCFKCLKGNHFSEKCFSREVCEICNKRHNTLLHVEEAELSRSTAAAGGTSSAVRSENISPSSTDVCTSVLTSNEKNLNTDDDNKIVLWPIAIVNVVDSTGVRHKCRALLDSASERNYVTADIVNKVNANCKPCNWQVNGVSCVSMTIKSTVNLNIESRTSDYKFTAKFGVMENITGRAPKCEVDMNKLKWPRHICLADPSFNKVGKIDMLLGTELFAKTLKKGNIDLGNGFPMLQNTKFGWVVHGAMNANVLETEISQTLVSSVSNLNDTMHKFWQVEELSGKNLLSDEERECENRYVKSVSRDDTGRYSVDLPLIEEKKLFCTGGVPGYKVVFRFEENNPEENISVFPEKFQ